MKRADVIWWNGKIVPWEQAKIHVTSECALRGLNVFEGLRAYWRPRQNAYCVVGLNHHLDRLESSARLLSIPAEGIRESVLDGIHRILDHNDKPADIYLRPTIYVEEGGYEVDPTKIKTGCFISWRRELPKATRELKCGISSWAHIPSNCLPSQAKIGARYTAFRLARLEVLSKGLDEAILLNQNKEVTETPGGSIFVLNDGHFRTPPLVSGILPSITRRIIIELVCPSLGIHCAEQRITAQDLLSADGIMVTGTLDEVSRATTVDGQVFPKNEESSDMITQVEKAFLALCRSGEEEQVSQWFHLYSPRDFSR
jgi:branched-chain amino acid aminotransferase